MRVITDFISKTYYFVDSKALKIVVNFLPSLNISAEICMLKIHFSAKVVYVCTDSILNWVFIIGNLILKKIFIIQKK